MTKDQIIKRFTEKPYMLDMGANKLAMWFKTTRDVIIECKSIARGLSINEVISKPKKLKVLVIDIETAPMRAYVWKRWKENISLSQTISEWFMLTWAAKFVGESEVYSDKISPIEVSNEDDSRITKSLIKLIEQSDVIIAHNLKKFDLPCINARAIINGFKPLRPVLMIDTLDVSKRQFRFSSNKLDALAGYFGIRHKEDTSFELWSKCMNGDKDAINYMEFYNIGDVEILEKVYLKLRPWIKNHPNEALVSNIPCCPNCGSENIKEEGYYYTNVNKYIQYRCECGAVSRSRKGEKNDITITPNIR